MNLAAKSHFISTLIASFLSGMNQQSFCLIGLAVGETFKECSIFSHGTPGMSVGFQANTLAVAHRKETSVLSYLGSRWAPIFMVLEGSSRPRLTSFVSLDLAEARGGSSSRISMSSMGAILASATTLAIWMERSVASTRARLSVSQA